MKFLLILTLVVLTLGQERCHAPRVPVGVCSLFDDCLALKTLSLNGTLADFIRDYGGCGTRNGNVELCCPVPASIETQCPSPSVFFDGLGCITPSTYVGSWTGAQADCKSIGGRNLEGLVSKEQIKLVSEYFYLNPGPSNAIFIGIKNGKWFEGGDAVPSVLWASGEPNGSPSIPNDCGYIDMTNFVLFDGNCWGESESFCQIELTGKSEE